MGEYDSDDEYDRKKKKKSKRSARSRSRSNDSRVVRKSKDKRKRSSSRKRYKSRSRSRDYHKHRSRRSRSYSGDRYRSRSRGRQKSRDRSYNYRRSRSKSKDRSRSNSRSRYRRSRSRSRDRRRRSPSFSSSASASREHSTSRSGMEKSLADMTPSEQNQARMQLAIEKAKAADEAIRQRHGLDDDEPADTKRRQEAITDIESEGFSQQTFSSNKNTVNRSSEKKGNEFSFGTSLDFVKSGSGGTSYDSDTLMHSRFSEDESIRKKRWHEILKKLRIKFMSS